METTELREKLHNMIEQSSDKELQEILSFIEKDYTYKLKSALNEQYDGDIKNGLSLSHPEVKKLAEELIKPGKRNSL